MIALNSNGHAPELDQELLDAAVALGGELEFGELVRRLAPSLRKLPGAVVGGLCLNDAERQALRLFGVGLRSSDDAGHVRFRESPADAGGPAFLLEGGDGPSDVNGEAEFLTEWGVRRCLSVPMCLGERRLGALFAASASADAFPAEAVEYLERLARVVTPIVWNCFVEEHFARGDRRRDALVELSRTINSSLDLERVLEGARGVIGRLVEDGVSWLGVLEPEGERFRRYEHFRPGVDSVRERPALVRKAGTVMAWLEENGETYRSGDLARETHFDEDVDLVTRGVRRYVAAPLLARGRFVGGFFLGTSDPQPPLETDVWLYENIALQLALAVENAIQHREVKRLSAKRALENVYLREEIQSEHDFEGLIGDSPAMRQVFDKIERVAATDSSVLILGPTGVGKELVARAVHAASRRASHPMVKLNCAAIPEGTVESELFGHERGAFTSAVERRIGRFELAQEGTLFLDEIGELPPGVQAKLLRVLQDGDFERVGGTKTLVSDARIISATNRRLDDELESGGFRQDLFYRLNVFPIEVPPLADRRGDIRLLVEAFVQQFQRRSAKRIEGVDEEALAFLEARDWPGNVRELRHVIERAIILCDGPVLRLGDVSSGAPPNGSATASVDRTSLTLEAVEAEHVRRVLESTSWVVEGPRGAAQVLGLAPSTLRFRMKRLGVKRPD